MNLNNFSYKLSICFVSFMVLMCFSLIFFMCGVFYYVSDYVVFLDWEILSINSSSIVMTILLDFKSLTFISFVFFISSLVIYYSDGYMSGDTHLVRFIMLVLMFVMSMMFLIISPNIISILLGWDGLGLVSYCLVIYYQNVKSYNAGMLTALSNRIGDVAILLCISWMMMYGSWNYLYWGGVMNSMELKVVVYLMILAAFTKSAQIPFSSWLPAAMAAPTPVSALVHSSTLVTAGVYLLIRFGNLLSEIGINNLILYVGCLTMFMAGLGANFEFDLKKIIALSTLSQLGLMMLTIGLEFYDLAYFHLLSHALFKALLFMCAGLIIHSVGNLQDIRGMGGIFNMMPCTSICFCISNLALCGMPFLAGFYSKDLILEMSLMNNLNMFIFLLMFLSTGLTVCYTIRLIYYVMGTNYNCWNNHCIGSENLVFIIPMVVLTLFSVLGGSMLSWIMIGTPNLIYLPLWMKFITLVVCVMGGWLGYELNLFSSIYKCSKISFLMSFLGSMWFMPILSTHFFTSKFLWLGYYVQRDVDMGWSEELGSQGLYDYMINFSGVTYKWHNNLFKLYLMSFVIWMLLIFMYFLV
uniref:NADH-ubiquinone oxidoreductase chain 5 n=1 Tax=Cacoplistes rogenhoferi TaxID=2316737 RepID=A0A385I1W5_9ORTH|nr:NADH dehydrogenase subunit 5 [Cacoplistes rogenhoferi]AXY63905.1 NADH dehydrogenase subunit 5 [Cacoplistes rogenhoferi]